MSERSLSVSSALEPFAGGMIGLGIGYSLAPRKYSLRSLIKLDSDTFEKIYTKDLAESLSDEDKQALNTIKNAREEYHISKGSLAAEIKEKAKKWKSLYDRIEIKESLKTEQLNRKKQLKELYEKIDYESISRHYNQTKKIYRQNPDNEMIMGQFVKASAKLAEVRANISGEIAAYRSAVKNVSLAKSTALKENPAKYIDVVEAFHELASVYAKRQTIVSSKLFELSNDVNIRKSYEAMKEFLPKARTKSAVWGAIIMSSLTALIVHILNKSTERMA